MVERLGRQWRSDLDVDELIALTGALDSQLQEIRTTRDIRPPVIRCPKCGERGPAVPSRVTVRAVIIAAKRFGVIDEPEAARFERLWKRHRVAHGLDVYGVIPPS